MMIVLFAIIIIGLSIFLICPIDCFRVLQPSNLDTSRYHRIFCESDKGHSSLQFPQSRSQFQRNFAQSLSTQLRKLLLPTSCFAFVTIKRVAANEGLESGLNGSEPIVTDTCWMDIQKEKEDEMNRVEISLFGKPGFLSGYYYDWFTGSVVPRTVQNFKELCLRRDYVGSEVFRVIPSFSVQLGNIGASVDSPVSKRSLFGRSAGNEGKGFEIENFLVDHDHPSSGIVSMMKDNKGLQDSRFFITLSPLASWADGKYAAFGRVTRGMDFIRSLQEEETKKPSNHPVKDIKIVDCGCYSK